MHRLTDYLSAHWVAVALLLAAAVLAVRSRRRLVPLGLALFAAGGLTLTNVAFGSFAGTVEPAGWLAALGGGGLLLAAVVLAFGRVWSPTLAVVFAGLLAVGVGGLTEAPISAALTEAGKSLRGLHFVRPWWLVLLGLVPLIVLLARRSLSGLGPTRKWLAIGARVTVVTLLVLALAEPRLQKPGENTTVLFVVDRSYSVPQDVDAELRATDQTDRRWARIQKFIDESVRLRGVEHRRDQAGVILFGKRPRLALPPAATTHLPVDDRMAGPIDGQYTDIAAALKLALASFPEGTGRRIVLVSDGNENLGAAEEQASIAKQNGIPIDVVALAPGYRNQSEVLVVAVESPPTTAAGTRLPVRVLVRNASPTRNVDGLLELQRVGVDKDGNETVELVPIDAEQMQVLEPSPDGRKPPRVRLVPGLNALKFRDKPAAPGDSSFSYRATFVPIQSSNPDGGERVAGMPLDRVANNRATTAVVSVGQRRVLFVDEPKDGESPHRHLVATLRKAKLRVDAVPVTRLPQDKDQFQLFLSNYDCVVLANVPAETLTLDQMEAVRSGVHDQGCGLVMVGGPDAYGPGGYQATPIEAALPVDCEIKALKAAGKGGLILIMHASEMADGNKWQKDIAKLAIQRLNPQDMVGVMQYGFGGGNGVSWVIPFDEIGGRRPDLLARVDQMTPGDMPDFDPFLTTAVDTLTNPDFNLAVKHTIIISDGDPQYGANGRAAVAKMAANNVSCTTVGVATHSGAESGKLKSIAAGTKDGKGQPGSYYEPRDPAQLPAIYIKESRRISQSFIYDKPFGPQLRIRGGPTDGLPNPLPALRGFVRTTLKESPLAEMRVEGPRVFDQQFPILATWQYGLGKGVAFTSDARTQPDSGVSGWDSDWVQSDVYQKHWEQVVSWAMRAAEKGKLTMSSEYKDGVVRVTVDARDEKGRPLPSVDLTGGLTLPKPPGPGEKVPQLNFKRKGAGRYEAEFTAQEAGSYFVYVQGNQAAGGGAKGELIDNTRTGITVPYSPEFADLESNTPLLKRLAEATGGRFFTDDPAELDGVARSAALFAETPKPARALTPFWFWLVFAAGVLLLFDVGVRRVSVEWHEVRAFAGVTWARLRAQPAADGVSSEMDRLRRRKLEAAEAIDRGRAARRFDETLAPPAAAAPAGADEVVRDGPRLPLPPPPPRTGETTTDEPEDTFAKLRKAKQRAKEQMERKDDEK